MTEEFNPLVSIVIPVYNGSNYMREAIDSALAQTYKNIEVLVINDGSNDNGATKEIALSYGDRIRYFEKENGGVSTALNLGIREMRGEYFSWLSHDDVYYTEKVEKQILFLTGLSDKNIILYSDYDYIDHSSNLVEVVKIKTIEPNNFRSSLMHSHPIHGCTALVPRKCFYISGIFNENLKTTQDYDLWFRMAGLFDFLHIPLVLIQSRIHNEQGSKTITSFRQEIDDFYKKCLDEIFGKNISSTSKKVIVPLTYWQLALIYKKNGYDSASHRSLELSNKPLLINKIFFEIIIMAGKVFRKRKGVINESKYYRRKINN